MAAELSARETARLQTNSPQWANRHVTVRGKRFAILHLPIIELEEFRAATESAEEVLKLVSDGKSFSEACGKSRNKIAEFLKNDAPYAAALALRLHVDDVRRLAHPLEILGVVIEQWKHNGEIADLRKTFPYPEDEDDDKDDGEGANPMSVAERMASAYHWPLDEVYRRTLPQIYLMGVSSAWSYKKVKDKSDSDKPQHKKAKAPNLQQSPGGTGITYRGVHYSGLKELSKDQKLYRQYMADMMNGVYKDAMMPRKPGRG